MNTQWPESQPANSFWRSTTPQEMSPWWLVASLARDQWAKSRGAKRAPDVWLIAKLAKVDWSFFTSLLASCVSAGECHQLADSTPIGSPRTIVGACWLDWLDWRLASVASCSMESERMRASTVGPGALGFRLVDARASKLASERVPSHWGLGGCVWPYCCSSGSIKRT